MSRRPTGICDTFYNTFMMCVCVLSSINHILTVYGTSDRIHILTGNYNVFFKAQNSKPLNSSCFIPCIRYGATIVKLIRHSGRTGILVFCGYECFLYTYNLFLLILNFLGI